MAISKVVSASITTDAVGPTQLNEASNYAFTGTVTGAGGVNNTYFEAYLSSSQTGIYEVTFNASYYKDGDTRYITSRIEATANNSTYEELARVHNNIQKFYLLHKLNHLFQNLLKNLYH